MLSLLLKRDKYTIHQWGSPLDPLHIIPSIHFSKNNEEVVFLRREERFGIPLFCRIPIINTVFYWLFAYQPIRKTFYNQSIIKQSVSQLESLKLERYVNKI
jgi:hypothetical protein